MIFVHLNSKYKKVENLIYRVQDLLISVFLPLNDFSLVFFDNVGFFFFLFVICFSNRAGLGAGGDAF